MKIGKLGFTLLLWTLIFPFPGISNTVMENQPALNKVETKADNGIFKNKKKKKKDCDCPGNKKNRRKVARERRKNRTT